MLLGCRPCLRVLLLTCPHSPPWKAQGSQLSPRGLTWSLSAWLPRCSWAVTPSPLVPSPFLVQSPGQEPGPSHATKSHQLRLCNLSHLVESGVYRTFRGEELRVCDGCGVYLSVHHLQQTLHPLRCSLLCSLRGSGSASSFLLLGGSEGTYLRQILFSRHLVSSSGKFFPPGLHLKIGPVDLCLQRINALLPKDSGANSEIHLPGGLRPGGHLCSYKMGAPLTPSAF